MSVDPSPIELAVRGLEQSLTATFTRRSGATHPLGALAALLRASAAFSPETTFDYGVEGNQTAEPSEAWLASWFGALTDPFRREQFGGLTLATRGTPPLTLQYFRDLMTPGARYDQVRISFPWPWGDSPRESPAWAVPARLFEYLHMAARAFGSEVAWLHSFDLFALVRTATLGDYDAELGVPEELSLRFGRLLPQEQIDRAAVPEAIGWVNVWSREVVERLGRARVESCPWEHRVAGDAGELLLVATARSPDRTRLEDLRKLTELIDRLDLPGVQGAYPPKASGTPFE